MLYFSVAFILCCNYTLTLIKCSLSFSLFRSLCGAGWSSSAPAASADLQVWDSADNWMLPFWFVFSYCPSFHSYLWTPVIAPFFQLNMCWQFSQWSAIRNCDLIPVTHQQDCHPLYHKFYWFLICLFNRLIGQSVKYQQIATLKRGNPELDKELRKKDPSLPSILHFLIPEAMIMLSCGQGHEQL